MSQRQKSIFQIAFFTISTHGIMESWKQYCLACHDLFQAIALEPEADDSRRLIRLIFLWVSHEFSNSHWVFHSILKISMFFLDLSGLRAKIFGSTSLCCWKVSLWEAFRLTPRIAFLGDTGIPWNTYKPSLPTVGGEALQI